MGNNGKKILISLDRRRQFSVLLHQQQLINNFNCIRRNYIMQVPRGDLVTVSVVAKND